MKMTLTIIEIVPQNRINKLSFFLLVFFLSLNGFSIYLYEIIDKQKLDIKLSAIKSKLRSSKK